MGLQTVGPQSLANQTNVSWQLQWVSRLLGLSPWLIKQMFHGSYNGSPDCWSSVPGQSNKCFMAVTMGLQTVGPQSLANQTNVSWQLQWVSRLLGLSPWPIKQMFHGSYNGSPYCWASVPGQSNKCFMAVTMGLQTAGPQSVANQTNVSWQLQWVSRLLGLRLS